MNAVIQSKNLELYYGNFKALKGITMDIPEKQITALIGPSGCGKSTFLKTLNRMQDLVPGVRITGEALYRGQNILDPKLDVTALRRNIGMVFQKANPFPMSIYDNITYGPKLHGSHSKAELDEIVERSLRGAALWDEVKDRLKKSALGLSGGQQQRLCIARALAVNPDVLLMDEPTSSLDYGNQNLVLSRVRALADEGYTVLLSTHNPQHALWYADQVLALCEGKVAALGAPEKVLCPALIQQLYGTQTEFVNTSHGVLIVPAIERMG